MSQTVCNTTESGWTCHQEYMDPITRWAAETGWGIAVLGIGIAAALAVLCIMFVKWIERM